MSRRKVKYPTVKMSLKEVLAQSFAHFKALDESNAPIHGADVKYSPITFGLAGVIADLEGQRSISPMGYTRTTPGVLSVLGHEGQYRLDKGR